MKFRFVSDSNTIQSLMPGILALQSDLDFTTSEDGLPVTVECRPGDLEVTWDPLSGAGAAPDTAPDADQATSDDAPPSSGEAAIRYAQPAQFFRGLGILVEQLRESGSSNAGAKFPATGAAAPDTSVHTDAFATREQPQFTTIGPMFDLSRNAVITVDTFRFLLRKLAIMGHNAAMLYMEEVYEIEGQPYFGYLRGRYSADELRAIDDYATQFGIEVIPSIQTLAHLDEFLKWDAAKPVRDTRGVLLTDADATYHLIDKMIEAMGSVFRSRRIHIGQDESEDLGRGRHLDTYGHEARFDIFTRHLHRVLEIVERHGLEPMMWSDMLIKLASSTGEDYYSGDTELPDHIVNQTPKGVQMVYWDYYHTDESHYDRLIATHKQFGTTPAFAGGIWIWNTFGANYAFSSAASTAALRACKRNGVEDVYITLWGDDGNESNVLYTLAGLVQYAEHAYARRATGTPAAGQASAADPTPERLRRRVRFVTGIDYDNFFNLTYLDETPVTLPGNPRWDNPSKFLLWQDPLLGLMDAHVEAATSGTGVALEGLRQHYAQLGEKFRQAANPLFEVAEKLCTVLAVKSTLGVEIRHAYKAGATDELRRIAVDVLPALRTAVNTLREAHRKQWMQTFKPFGWEVLDIRYGGLLTRIESAQSRLSDYVNNRIDHIEELEQDLLFFHPNYDPSRGLGRVGYYYRTATPNAFFHVLPSAGW